MIGVPSTDEIPWDDPRRNITDLRVRAPYDWFGWPPGEADVDAITAQATSNPQAAAVLAEGIRVAERDLAARDGAYTHIVVWVPDPATGVIAGWLVVEVTGDVPEHDAIGTYMALNSAPPKVRGVKVFDYAVDVATDFPVGPTAMIAMTTAERRGPVSEDTICAVFPPGSNESVVLTFTSVDPSVSEQMADLCGLICGNMQITLGFSETSAP